MNGTPDVRIIAQVLCSHAVVARIAYYIKECSPLLQIDVRSALTVPTQTVTRQPDAACRSMVLPTQAPNICSSHWKSRFSCQTLPRAAIRSLPDLIHLTFITHLTHIALSLSHTSHVSRPPGLRDKEAAKRTAFAQQVERYLPPELLARAGITTPHGAGVSGGGLEGGLPHPVVTVPPPPPELLQVTLADVARVRLPQPYVPVTARASGSNIGSGEGQGLGERSMSGALAASTSGAAGAPATSTGTAAPVVSTATSVAASMAAMSAALAPPPARSGPGATATSPRGTGDGSGAGEGTGEGALPPPTSMPVLEMENARLRAELAGHIAAAALRELAAATNLGPSGPGSSSATASGMVAQQGPAEGALPSASSSQIALGVERSASWSRRGLAAEASSAGAAAKGGGPSSSLAASPSSGALPPRSPLISTQQAAASPLSSPSAASGMRPTTVTGEVTAATGAASSAAETTAVTALTKALAAKDVYAGKLAREVGELSARTSAYEARIAELEEAVRRAAFAAAAAPSPSTAGAATYPHSLPVARAGSGGSQTDGGAVVVTAAPSPVPSLGPTPEPGQGALGAAAHVEGATMPGMGAAVGGSQDLGPLSPLPARLALPGGAHMARVGSGGLMGPPAGVGLAALGGSSLAQSQPSLGNAGVVLGMGAGGAMGMGMHGGGPGILGGSPHLPLGPIALAALNGSRGHTPEPGPQQRHSLESVAGGFGAWQLAPPPPAPIMSSPVPKPAEAMRVQQQQQQQQTGQQPSFALPSLHAKSPAAPAAAATAVPPQAATDDPLGASSLGMQLSQSSMLLPLSSLPGSHAASSHGAASSASSAAPGIMAGARTASGSGMQGASSAAGSAAMAVPATEGSAASTAATPGQEAGTSGGSTLPMMVPLGSLPFAASFPIAGLSTALVAGALGQPVPAADEPAGQAPSQVEPTTAASAGQQPPGSVGMSAHAGTGTEISGLQQEGAGVSAATDLVAQELPQQQQQQTEQQLGQEQDPEPEQAQREQAGSGVMQTEAAGGPSTGAPSAMGTVVTQEHGEAGDEEEGDAPDIDDVMGEGGEVGGAYKS